MRDTPDQHEAREPSGRARPTIAEESRARWVPDDADVKEAGDDGPHGGGPSDDAPTAGDGADGTQPG